MPPTREEILQTYKKISVAGSPRGVDAEFISLKNGWGIKIFDSEVERDSHWQLQKLAAQYKLGPETGECFNVGYKFAYVTEEVETLIKFHGRSWNQNLNFEMAKKEFNDDSLHYRRLNKLVEELKEKLGWDFSDCHLGNIGIKNNRYICIDFG